jgi:alanine-glyoxylate transaminase/serine-glyoxylate transaminase/serine-pyruvate transaminase
MFETGSSPSLWHRIAQRLGLKPEFLSVPGTDPATGLPWSWRKPAQPELIEARLRQDRAHRDPRRLRGAQRNLDRRISDIAAVRRAIDAAGHPALLLVDTISGLACADYRHDEWGVDVAMAARRRA